MRPLRVEVSDAKVLEVTQRPPPRTSPERARPRALARPRGLDATANTETKERAAPLPFANPLPFASRARRGTRAGLLLAALLLLGAPLAAQERTYRVVAGDSLSRIARRNGTTVAALCRANRIDKDQVLRIGQRLILPTPRAEKATPALSKTEPRAPSAPARAKSQDPQSAQTKDQQTKNQQTKNQQTKTQEVKGAAPSRAPAKPRQPEPSWAPYVRTPERRGYLRLESTVGRWQGQALEGAWHIPESARAGITRALASWRTGNEERIHGRLIRLLVRVSDTFGGRPIRVVSGYRDRSPHQHTKHSKHYLGRAIDFSIPGVPNEVLRDYLLHTFENVGVGYYPNSTHVHLDIREQSAYWVDTSRPGQPPRYETISTPSKVLASKATTPTTASLQKTTVRTNTAQKATSQKATPTRPPKGASQTASPRRAAAPEREHSSSPLTGESPRDAQSSEQTPAAAAPPSPSAPSASDAPAVDTGSVPPAAGDE